MSRLGMLAPQLATRDSKRNRQHLVPPQVSVMDSVKGLEGSREQNFGMAALFDFHPKVEVKSSGSGEQFLV